MLGMRAETIGRTRCTVLLGTVDAGDRGVLRGLARPVRRVGDDRVVRHRVLAGKLWRLDPAGAVLLVEAARAARARGEEWTWSGALPGVAARLAELGEGEWLKDAAPDDARLAGWGFSRSA